jgi:sulfide:quinone oxidoreductase
VYETLGHAAAPRYPLAAVTRALDAGRRRDIIAAVDRPRREVHLRSGAVVPYDVLVMAIGAIPFPAFDHGVLFDPPRNAEAIEAMVRDVDSGSVRSIAVVVPPGSRWPFPAYELALLLAARAPRRLAVTLLTPEPEPLAVFGPPAAAMVRAEFGAAGIDLVCGVSMRVPSARIVETGLGRRLHVDRVIHLPGLTGPRIAGLPYDADGFIRVGADLHVEDDPDVFALGDGIAGPYKHGGLAALQADAIAQEIAVRAGAGLVPEPYRPVLYAVLRTPHGPRYLRADPPGGGGAFEVSDECLWWPPAKVFSRWLMPWLAATGPASTDRPVPGAS